MCSQIVSAKYECERPPRQMCDASTQTTYKCGLGRICPHISHSVNANVSWCVPDKNATGKCIINASSFLIDFDLMDFFFKETEADEARQS